MKNTLASRPISLYIIWGINEIGLNDKIQITQIYNPTEEYLYADHNNEKSVSNILIIHQILSVQIIVIF